MKKKSVVFLFYFCFSLILLYSCGFHPFSYYFPYSKISPNEVRYLSPMNYEESIPALNQILTDEVIAHFKDQDSAIAIIEISNEIGGYFVSNWGLDRYDKTFGTFIKLELEPKTPENLPSQFILDGIREPRAMIRVVFSCYYKYLNNIPYNWQEEIKILKSYWPNQEKIKSGYRSLENIRKRDWNIKNSYYYRLLSEGDTVVSLFSRPVSFFSKTPSWYFLTGIVVAKNAEAPIIDIRIIDIQSEFNRLTASIGEDEVHINDTISDYPINWHTIRYQYFDYHRNNYYPSKVEN